MSKQKFWNWFDNEVATRIAQREISFRKVFQYLDGLGARPIVIVETGCLRTVGNWGGDGQSTLLFDRYLEASETRSFGFAVDIDPAATAACRSQVSHLVEIRTGDSVLAMSELAKVLTERNTTIDLLYLDSFDLDWRNPGPSAIHHLKELVAISSRLRPDTLVVVDDAPMNGYMVDDGRGKLGLLGQPTVSGKGMYVAEYAAAVGASLAFSHYQSAWTNMVR